MATILTTKDPPTRQCAQRDLWKPKVGSPTSGKVWDRLKPLTGLHKARLLQDVYRDREFRTVLERECARAIRHGHGFSLVTFNVRANGGGRVSANRLVDVLASNLRSTDEIGWIEDTHLGILLYNTPPADAWHFARKVCKKNAAQLDCSVYAYPPLWDEADGAADAPEPREAVSVATLHPLAASTQTPHAEPAGESPAPTTDQAENLVEQTEGASAKVPAADASLLQSIRGAGLPLWKRAMDLAIATAGLVVLSPMFAAVALLIKAVSSGPVFFRQKRVGYLGRPFTLFKFRTMHVNNDASTHQEYLAGLINGKGKSDSPMTKLGNDPRVIRLGKLFRKTCIDEFPQLINVLRGEMSLVGPRPPIPYEADEYARWHSGRFDAVPGMTGLWQVSGKNRLSFTQMARLDIRYSREKSFWLDAEILFRTPGAIVNEVLDGFSGKPEMLPPHSAAENA